MSFWKTLSEKLGFMSGESDERDEDELEDGEIRMRTTTMKKRMNRNLLSVSL